jgi:hypothetical protein
MLFDEPCQRRVRPGVHLERTPHGIVATMIDDSSDDARL